MSEDIKDIDVNVWPGKVKFTGDVRGHYSGCIVEEFSSPHVAQQMNAYSEAHPERLIVNITPIMGGVLVAYTVTIDADQQWVLDQRAEAVQAEVQKRVDERNANARKERELKEKMEAEQRRLANVGLKCERNHKKDKKKGTSDADNQE